MIQAPKHPNENERLADLLHYEVLDTDAEAAFDELVELANSICGTPISLISLVDDSRQWFKAKVGLDADETPKSIAFCSHAILEEGVFEICNATEDKRFHDNPLVTGAPDIRFYAGMPLVTPGGLPIGTLCVIDQKPRRLTEEQTRALEILSHQVISQLEIRLNALKLKRINESREKLFAMVAHDLRTPFNSILSLSKTLSAKAEKLSTERVVAASHQVLGASLEAYQLLEELLQWSQQQLGSVEIKFTEEYLNGLINAGLSLLSEAIQLKEIHIDNQVEKNTLVYTDEVIAKTVFRNLLANAIKFSPRKGCILITGQVKEDKVEIAVTDEGPGIGAYKIAILFNSSVESESGTEGEVGAGLGLSLCHQFLAMQNNSIWVDEDYQHGTRIIFTLDLPE